MERTGSSEHAVTIMRKPIALIALTLAITSIAWGKDRPTRDDAQPRPVLVPAPQSLPVTAGTWVSQGPSPTHNGQTEGITNNPVIGAVQTVVAHPQNADVLWIGSVNGGIWKTTDAT